MTSKRSDHTHLGGPVHRLWPPPATELDLGGLFLDLDLASRAPQGRPLIYTTLVVSLDGRISVAPPGQRPVGVPEALRGERDWRLYQELAAQADVVLTSGRYVRDRAAGTAGPMLSFLTDPAYEDLMDWRRAHGLAEAPAVAILSGSLDFPGEAAADLGDRVLAVTGGAAPEGRMAELESAGVRVVVAGERGVDGARLGEALGDEGFRVAFNAAGGQIVRLLIEAGRLDLLVVTRVLRFLGGESYATLFDGPMLDPPAAFDLEALFLDDEGPGVAQTFSLYGPSR